MYINHFVSINTSRVIVDGAVINENENQNDNFSQKAQRAQKDGNENERLNELFKQYVGNYPKYYKMDPLCKVGFVASELLLDAEGERDRQWGESRGVVIFSASGSLADDRNYQKTIEGDEPFPSPSLFVYTLPNVLTGEIAIRNHYYGESNCFVLPSFDPEIMARAITSCFCDNCLLSLVTGWVDCYDENHYDATLFTVSRYSTIETIDTSRLQSEIFFNFP